MKRILALTDFSGPGNNAVHYAARFAKATNAALLVFHFAGRPGSFFSFFRDVSAGSIAAQQGAMESLVKELRDCEENTSDIKTTILKKDFTGGLNRICKIYDPDIVVIGSWGNSPQLGIFGGKAIYAGKNIKVPLIVVPAEYKFVKIDRVGMASDLKKNLPGAVSAFRKIADALQAAIHVLYAASNHLTNEKQFSQARELVNVLGAEHSYHTISSENVDDDVIDYLEKQGVQLLAVIPHKYGFWQSLFHTSHTNHFIRYSSIPVLVIQPSGS